jgi:hypothetical protein
MFPAESVGVWTPRCSDKVVVIKGVLKQGALGFQTHGHTMRKPFARMTCQMSRLYRTRLQCAHRGTVAKVPTVNRTATIAGRCKLLILW